MNTAIIMKTLTSRPARRIYRKVGMQSAKVAVAIVGEVTTYFAAQKIIKTVKEKTDFEPVETCTITIKTAAEA